MGRAKKQRMVQMKEVEATIEKLGEKQMK